MANNKKFFSNWWAKRTEAHFILKSISIIILNIKKELDVLY